MKRLLILLAVVATAVGCAPKGTRPEVSIVPRPVKVTDIDGFMLAQDTTGKITFSIDTTITNAEGYILRVDDNGVAIAGGSREAFHLALATLDQLVSADGLIPYVEIEDAPRFEWRGMMLDVARHYQPVEYIKEFIDILAYHKLNKFHFHLTDGIGWRIEIEAYPELTRRGAWRKIKDESVPFVGFELSEMGADSTTGGYYTKQDIKTIVDYAASKGIEVIPEIEMPGHSQAALDCYPSLRCDSSKVSDVYCAGNENTYKFLETILDEVIEIFPSQYIHIGGDEVGFDAWESCPKCKKISTKGNEVQAHFVRHMERYIAQKGRRMIGWDEVAKDGLGETAVVMSWTGFEGGETAAVAGYEVIMCPLHYVYLDHYQSQNDAEPQAWGGDNSLSRVWSFPVIPSHLPESLYARIKGGQANLWTELIQDPAHIEYLLLPRMGALSEALWVGDRKMDSTEWNEFEVRIDKQFERYAARDWNYSMSAYSPLLTQRGDTIELKSEIDLYPIHYTLDGSEPTEKSSVYTTPIIIDRYSTLRAATFRKGEKAGNELTINNLHHKATRGKVSYKNEPNGAYNGGGAAALTDNHYAIKRGDDKRWVGFEGVDMITTIELPSQQQIHEAIIRFFQHSSTTSVVLPTNLTISTSMDGATFTELYNQPIKTSTELNAFTLPVVARFTPTAARFVRIEAKNPAILPDGNPRAGAAAWIFTDEIAIN